jgi:16S rRNA processing protein RimM
MVAVGRIVKPFGVRGTVRVESLSDVPGRFEGLGEVTLSGPGGRVRTARVTEVRPAGSHYLVTLDAFASPEEAGLWRDALINIPNTEAPPLPEGQFYEFTLLGLAVRTEEGQSLGTIEEIFETPANHVFVVRDGRQERLVPALKQVVLAVDQAARTMTVRLPGEVTVEQAERVHAV